MMLHTIQEARISKAAILLDEPVSNSGRRKALIADIGEELALGAKGETKRAYREEDFDFGKIHYEKY